MQHTILIIDDTPANLKLLHDVLTKEGYRIRIANSSVQGLQSAKSVPPDLILLDVQMPEMDGYALCRELKADPLTNPIPIIFISASDEGAFNTVKAFEVGGIDYISKPFNAVEVLARIKNHLRLSILQKQIRESLATSQHMLQAVVNHSPTVVYIKDLDGRYLLANREFERILNVPEGSILGKTDLDIFPLKSAKLFRQEDQNVLRCDNHKQFEESIEVNGETRTYLSFKFPLQDENGENYAVGGISTDITSRKHAEAEMERLATYDNLTQLPNRTLLMALLEQTLLTLERDKTRNAILFLDLDNFKNINDSLGHHIGDELLKRVSERLRNCMRKQDTVARMGGDEFVVLLRNIKQPAEAAEVSNKIIGALEASFRLEGRDVFISPSIGIVITPDNGQDSQTLLRNADTAMYHAKAKGRNTFQFFTEEMNQGVLQRLETEKDLRIALKDGGILPYYQPKVDTRTGKIIGMEALARWHHPERGNISPGVFIPIAEESDLIFAVDRYILKAVIEQVGPLINEGLFDGRVSVNLGAHHFSREHLLEYIDELLVEHHFPANSLELELTEGSVMKNAEEAITLMYALRDRGIQLSIDDFGTGYSSLSYLKQFPANTLKIDISFIRDIEVSDKDKHLVEAIINLAHGLGLECIAEGVETLEQARILNEMGCDSLQGFLFRPAITFEEIVELLSVKDMYKVLDRPGQTRAVGNMSITKLKTA